MSGGGMDRASGTARRGGRGPPRDHRKRVDPVAGTVVRVRATAPDGTVTVAGRALIIDDEDDIRELIAGILEDEGFRVRQSGHARGALIAVSTAIQTLGSAAGAYDLLKGAAALIGVHLPYSIGNQKGD